MEFYLFILCHILGDYIFQPRELVKFKNENIIGIILHSLIYTICFIPFAIFLSTQWYYYLLFFSAIFVTHFLIDFAKVKIEKKNKKISIKSIVVAADQFLHLILMMICIPLCFTERWGIQLNSFFQYVFKINSIQFVKFITVILFLIKPCSILVQGILDYLPANISKSKTDQTAKEEKVEQIDAGKLIGYLERITIFAGFLAGCPQIVFPVVISVKTLARFPKINSRESACDGNKEGKSNKKEKDFSEVFIIGTLLSSVLVLTCYYYYGYVNF